MKSVSATVHRDALLALDKAYLEFFEKESEILVDSTVEALDFTLPKSSAMQFWAARAIIKAELIKKRWDVFIKFRVDPKEWNI